MTSASAPGTAPDLPVSLRATGAEPAGSRAPADAMVTFRMFASARDSSGSSEVHVAPGPTCAVVAALAAGLPPRFSDVLAVSSLVADGHRLDPSSPAPIVGGTVIDVLPPFAGG